MLTDSIWMSNYRNRTMWYIIKNKVVLGSNNSNQTDHFTIKVIGSDYIQPVVNIQKCRHLPSIQSGFGRIFLTSDLLKVYFRNGTQSHNGTWSTPLFWSRSINAGQKLIESYIIHHIHIKYLRLYPQIRLLNTIKSKAAIKQ